MNVWLVCFDQHVLVDTLHGLHVCLATSLARTLSLPKSCVIFLHVTSKNDQFYQFHTKLYGTQKLNVNLSRWCKFTLLAEPSFCLLDFGVLEKDSARIE